MFWCFVVVEVCQNSSFVSGMQFYLFFVIIHTVIDTYKLETQYNFIISVFKTMIFELLYHIVFVKYWYFHKNQNLSSSWKWLLLMWRNEINLNFIPPVFCNLSQAKYPCYEKWCLLGSDSFYWSHVNELSQWEKPLHIWNFSFGWDHFHWTWNDDTQTLILISSWNFTKSNQKFFSFKPLRNLKNKMFYYWRECSCCMMHRKPTP